MTQSPARGGNRRLDNPSIVNQFDRPKVVVRRAQDQPAETNVLPIRFDILFDEPVIDFPTGINSGGIVFSGSATGLRYEVTGEKATYQLTVRSIVQDGDLVLSVPAELAADLFGNLNTASTGEGAVVQFDATRPRCVIQSAQEGVMNDARMNIALVFSEPVYGLRDSALTLENASIERVAGKDGDKQYHFVVTPRADGTTALTLPEDAATDAVGNGNTASPVFSLIVDSTGPTVLLSSFETPEASNSWLMRVHAVFNEPVFEFEKDDVVVQGGSLQNFTARDDGVTWIFDVKPTEGEVRLSIPAGAARDVIGNPSSASGVFIRQIDRSRPTVQISVLEGLTKAGQPVVVDVVFSEEVYGFDAEELRVSRGTTHRISGRDGDAVYRYLVAPSGKRAVELRVKSGVVNDLAGNRNKAATVRFTPTVSERHNGEPGKAAPPLTQ